MARTRGAGPYGAAAWPAIVTYFASVGVLVGRSLSSVLRRHIDRRIALVVAVLLGFAAAWASALVFNASDAGQPLLIPLFGVLVAAAALWAATAPAATRFCARLTAVLAGAGMAVALGARL